MAEATDGAATEMEPNLEIIEGRLERLLGVEPSVTYDREHGYSYDKSQFPPIEPSRHHPDDSYPPPQSRPYLVTAHGTLSEHEPYSGYATGDFVTAAGSKVHVKFDFDQRISDQDKTQGGKLVDDDLGEEITGFNISVASPEAPDQPITYRKDWDTGDFVKRTGDEGDFVHTDDDDLRNLDKILTEIDGQFKESRRKDPDYDPSEDD